MTGVVCRQGFSQVLLATADTWEAEWEKLNDSASHVSAAGGSGARQPLQAAGPGPAAKRARELSPPPPESHDPLQDVGLGRGLGFRL